jgi:hypothetical protein
MWMTIDFASAPLHAPAESVPSMLDILLPEILRAFTVADGSHYLGIKFPGRPVSLTRDDPSSVLLHYETDPATTQLYETFQLDENGCLVKVRSSPTPPWADPEQFEF